MYQTESSIFTPLLENAGILLGILLFCQTASCFHIIFTSYSIHIQQLFTQTEGKGRPLWSKHATLVSCQCKVIVGLEDSHPVG